MNKNRKNQNLQCTLKKYLHYSYLENKIFFLKKNKNCKQACLFTIKKKRNLNWHKINK